MSKFIALGHRARVGKDTTADYLVQKYGYTKMAFSDGLYRVTAGIQTELGLPICKDRALLQTVGCGLRNVYGENIWVDQCMARVGQAQGRIVITDVRFPNEMTAVKAAGFTTVRITRQTAPILGHISEHALDGAAFDHDIANDGDHDQLHAAIDQLLGI